jgi:hypothetical protein
MSGATEVVRSRETAFLRLIAVRDAVRGAAADSFAQMRRWGSRLVQYLEGPKRGLKRGWAQSLSCINAIEVQVNLDGRIHPKPAPRADAWP